MYLHSLKLWNFRKYRIDGEFNIEKPNLSLFFRSGLNLVGNIDVTRWYRACGKTVGSYVMLVAKAYKAVR